MKVSSDWLKNWLSRTILSDSELVTALERAGIEVEQLIVSPPIDERVVVGLVKKVIQHPNAERLNIAEVSTGADSLHIVCGAPNLKSGMKVAVAQIGTILPSGDRIKSAKLRGEVSEGMLCSERELALGSSHEGIIALPDDSVVGARLCDLFPSDAVIDIKTAANRWDLQSVVGLAREAAAMTSATLIPYEHKSFAIKTPGPIITIDGPVSRYMIMKMAIDQNSPTPAKLVARLRASGMRAIGPVVDVTNYVMLELGQPLHAFDAAKVKLPISVRLARVDEQLVTLDGQVRKLTADDLVIADATGPIALAGVMGGASTEVSSDTTEIYLESAVFDPATVRKMAQRHGLRSEASSRFERGLPVELPPLGVARVSELLAEISQGKQLALTDITGTKIKGRSIEVELDKLVKLIGVKISGKQAVKALQALQIPSQLKKASEHGPGEVLLVDEVPWWRSDLKLWEDLAEEVVRVLGYDKVPSTIPAWRPKRLIVDHEWSGRRRVRDLLSGAGLFEVMTYSFVSSEQLDRVGLKKTDHMKLKNPLSVEQAYLRSILLPSHLEVVVRNRTYAKSFSFFEISRVFSIHESGKLPLEPLKLAVTGYQAKSSYYQVKGVLDALAAELNVDINVSPDGDAVFAQGRSGLIKLGSEPVGRIGQVHPSLLRGLKIDAEVAHFELDLDAILAAASPRQFQGTHRFPSIIRDLSLLVPISVTWQQVVSAAKDFELTFVGDYYEGLPEGYKSLTMRVEIVHPERTPTESEAAEIEARLVKELGRKVGSRRRD